MKNILMIFLVICFFISCEKKNTIVLNSDSTNGSIVEPQSSSEKEIEADDETEIVESDYDNSTGYWKLDYLVGEDNNKLKNRPFVYMTMVATNGSRRGDKLWVLYNKVPKEIRLSIKGDNVGGTIGTVHFLGEGNEWAYKCGIDDYDDSTLYITNPEHVEKVCQILDQGHYTMGMAFEIDGKAIDSWLFEVTDETGGLLNARSQFLDE